MDNSLPPIESIGEFPEKQSTKDGEFIIPVTGDSKEVVFEKKSQPLVQEEEAAVDKRTDESVDIGVDPNATKDTKEHNETESVLTKGVLEEQEKIASLVE